MIPVKVIFGLLEKIERLFGKRKNRLLHHDTGESSVEGHGSSRESGKWTARDGRKDNFRWTGRITIQDLLDPVALHFQEALRLRLRRLHQAVSDGFFLSLSQLRRESYLARTGVVRSADNIGVPAFIGITERTLCGSN